MIKQAFLLMALLNLAVGCGFGYLFIYQYPVFTVINAYIVVACLVDLSKTKNYNLQRCINVVMYIAKLAALVGFFILECNVFVLDRGVRSCTTCAIANVGIIIAGALYLLFYLCFLCAYIGKFILDSNIIKMNK